MALSPPRYIPIAILQKAPVTHSWDDWDPYPLVGTQREETMDRLARLSDRAIIAFAIGCAEWVVFRLGNLSTDPTPLDFLEAAWAFEMDKEIESLPESEDKDWQGPIRGPLDLSLMTILNTYYTTEEGTAEIEGAFAELVALHVQHDTSYFEAWRKRALQRLSDHYPRKKSDTWGPPVPREVLDPAVKISPELAQEYVQRFLDGLDFEKNPFLKRVPGGDNSR
ncbi:MAG: hypothetical protein AB1792_12120 [Candidatus Zixiibacteriota bacterium]